MTTVLSDNRALLQGLYLELTAELEETSAVASAVGGMDIGDEADVGSRAEAREQQLTLAASIRARRDQVGAALQRLDDGTYGRCATCGEAIPAERLEACPWVTECVACKRAHER
jgi:RNA polymerase-binding transcription factor DksA